MSGAAADAFWDRLEEQEAERSAAERRAELRDRVPSDFESLTEFRILSTSPLFQARPTLPASSGSADPVRSEEAAAEKAPRPGDGAASSAPRGAWSGH
jgi:hypothetical protein